VIVPDEIRKYVPVLVAPKGVQIVEWEKDQVEDSGLLKIDLLETGAWRWFEIQSAK